MALRKRAPWVTLLALLLLLLCAGGVLVAYWVLSLSGGAPPPAPVTLAVAASPSPSPPSEARATMAFTPLLTVHIIDVGQGDAILFQGPDFTLLIDAGRHDREDVVPYLQSIGVKQLDLLVGTHPHADHIGQFPQVLEAFPVGEVWLPGTEATSAVYERAIDAVLTSNAAYHEP